MQTLDPDWWPAVAPYLDQALGMPEEERAAWLVSLGEREPAAGYRTGCAPPTSTARWREEGFLENRPAPLPRSPGLAESEMALFFRAHPVVCSEKSLTPPTLLEMGILQQ